MRKSNRRRQGQLHWGQDIYPSSFEIAISHGGVQLSHSALIWSGEDKKVAREIKFSRAIKFTGDNRELTNDRSYGLFRSRFWRMTPLR
jgi:hypothetical protein